MGVTWLQVENIPSAHKKTIIFIEVRFTYNTGKETFHKARNFRI